MSYSKNTQNYKKIQIYFDGEKHKNYLNLTRFYSNIVYK